MTDSVTPANRKVVVVEDHPLFSAMLVQLIGQEPGMSVIGATDNILDAMEIIENNPVDLAIVDLTLQGSSGLELIKNLKTRRIQLPVLVISMHSESLYAERVLQAGAMGYLSKLEPPAEVVLAIRKVADGGIYVSERVNATILGRLGRSEKARQPAGMDLLSDREIEVFYFFGLGLNSREIAAQIHLGVSSIDSYRSRIKEKLHIRSAAELYQHAARWVAEQGL